MIFVFCRYSEIRKAFLCEICASIFVQKLNGIGRFEAVPEKTSAGPIQIPAVPKMKDSEMKKIFECDCGSNPAFQNDHFSAVAEKKESVLKEKNSNFGKKNLAKKHSCEKCGSIFFIKKSDGSSECKTCAFQNENLSTSPEKRNFDHQRLERFLTVLDKCLTVFAKHRQT